MCVAGEGSVLSVCCRGGFSIEFKTEEEDGMIMYMANERQVDFIALYMQGGRIVFMFNCGSGPARLTSAGTFNDGQWHTVRQPALAAVFTEPSQLWQALFYSYSCLFPVVTFCFLLCEIQLCKMI